MINIGIKTGQQGLTLIEIMIALVLGAFLIGGVLQIFNSSKQTYRLQENMSRMQENGRFAMDFISRDLRMADFWGCLRNGLDDISNQLDPGGTGYDAVYHGFEDGIIGSDGTAGANAALDAPDTITLRGLLDGGIPVEPSGLGNFGPLASSRLHIEADNPLEQGDVVVVADCTQADIFQISNANPGTSGVAVHNTGNATEPGNLNSDASCGGGNAHCLSKVYEGDAAIYLPVTINYSIQTGANGRPALFRQIDAAAATELVEGIENMQLLYGVDTDVPGDGTPNFYAPAPVDNPVGTLSDFMDQVVSIRVNLLSATVEEFLTPQAVDFTYNGVTTTPINEPGPPTRPDTRLRREFFSTFAVRNRLL